MLLKTKYLLKLAVVASCALTLQLMAETSKATSGTAEDNAYAAKVWQYMLKNKLIGKDRIRSFPFKGNRPHGSIQELISTNAEIEGHTGKLIVKHNYGSKDGLTKEEVYGADQAENYVALTIMYQREKGYDSANDDWFWAEYNADGSIINHQEVDLSGRSKFCLACHTPLGGKDREIMNGRSL
ncbi:MAG: hypothetical protein ACI9IA_001819 [Enterobacterales bacterium]|jgi:hypothetical protein